jgi:hypothetical protein
MSILGKLPEGASAGVFDFVAFGDDFVGFDWGGAGGTVFSGFPSI